MNDESFAWAAEDERAICREHNDAFAKMIGDAHFEATLENAYRNMESLRATRDTASIHASNERLKESKTLQAAPAQTQSGRGQHPAIAQKVSSS